MSSTDKNELLSAFGSRGTQGQFELASTENHPEVNTENEIRTWASTKTISAATRGNDKGKLYRPFVDPYEIRVLEIKPGANSEKLQGSLHHCSVEFESEPKDFLAFKGETLIETRQSRLTYKYLTMYALSMDDLTTPVFYTALSYTWGSQIFDGIIECDGHEKAITKSLEAALRNFRKPDRSVVMWIDQICIDQDNSTEKEKQIPMMGKIYQHAWNTVIWRNLWNLLSRPWFKRLWIIQEVMLSRNLWVTCGDSLITWDNLSNSCIHFSACGISQWLQQHFLDSSSTSGRVDICKSIIDLSLEKSFHEGHEDGLPLFELLVATRYAQCYDSRDKIYGLLAVCRNNDRTAARTSYVPDFTAAELYRDMTFHHLADNLGGLRLTSVLTSVDHDSPDLPSWVPDWRRPRETTALGYSTSAQSIYNPNGRFQPKIGQIDYTLNSQKKNELQAQGIFFDTLIKASELYIDPDLTYLNPSTNRTLLEFFKIASQLQHYPAPNTIFSAFWHTLVAGKDASGRLKCPSSFAEIISLLLDASTGRLELVSLASRTAGKTFQEVRTAMKLAVKNRKLGITEKGYLGLFPRHTEVGDGFQSITAGSPEDN
ncbi:hypothetical protein L207DRAFT_572752 [Hyaloscypha variabilis F]|uniref:Heterokaryon incompatibility domain-containing protein n=1 Tax=Hyaloscypha variabilis (strain UAMH 11265 / GT02V1 / F) TaxID=1149755 RepID=A0A2J6QZ74_HYAVF|nr:hypothetical protein L207DRAFT_572752 [Hyaloscypha variabilis F]